VGQSVPYPGFCSIKWLGVFLLPSPPWHRMLVHHRVTYSLPSLDVTLPLSGEQLRARRHFNLERHFYGHANKATVVVVGTLGQLFFAVSVTSSLFTGWGC